VSFVDNEEHGGGAPFNKKKNLTMRPKPTTTQNSVVLGENQPTKTIREKRRGAKKNWGGGFQSTGYHGKKIRTLKKSRSKDFQLINSH